MTATYFKRTRLPPAPVSVPPVVLLLPPAAASFPPSTAWHPPAAAAYLMQLPPSLLLMPGRSGSLLQLPPTIVQQPPSLPLPSVSSLQAVPEQPAEVRATLEDLLNGIGGPPPRPRISRSISSILNPCTNALLESPISWRPCPACGELVCQESCGCKIRGCRH